MEPENQSHNLWYYAKDGERLGPCSAAALKLLAVKGKLVADDLIWKEGLQDWIRAGTIKGLIPTVAVPPLPNRSTAPPDLPLAPPSNAKIHEAVAKNDAGKIVGSLLLILSVGVFLLARKDVLPDIAVILMNVLAAAYVFIDARSNHIGKIEKSFSQAYGSRLKWWQRPFNYSTGAWSAFPLVLGFPGLAIYLRWRNPLRVKALTYPVVQSNGFLTLAVWVTIFLVTYGYAFYAETGQSESATADSDRSTKTLSDITGSIGNAINRTIASVSPKPKLTSEYLKGEWACQGKSEYLYESGGVGLRDPKIAGDLKWEITGPDTYRVSSTSEDIRMDIKVADVTDTSYEKNFLYVYSPTRGKNTFEPGRLVQECKLIKKEIFPPAPLDAVVDQVNLLGENSPLFKTDRICNNIYRTMQRVAEGHGPESIRRLQVESMLTANIQRLCM